jgi:hypothetical protein
VARAGALGDPLAARLAVEPALSAPLATAGGALCCPRNARARLVSETRAADDAGAERADRLLHRRDRPAR